MGRTRPYACPPRAPAEREISHGELIGGIAPFLGRDNRITGKGEADFIFGDPFTTGNTLGVPEIGGSLSSSDEAGNDRPGCRPDRTCFCHSGGLLPD